MKLNRSINDKNNPTAVEVLSAVVKSYCGVEFRFNNIKKTMFNLTDSVFPEIYRNDGQGFFVDDGSETL